MSSSVVGWSLRKTRARDWARSNAEVAEIAMRAHRVRSLAQPQTGITYGSYFPAPGPAPAPVPAGNGPAETRLPTHFERQQITV
jgi:hypothetical protein